MSYSRTFRFGLAAALGAVALTSGAIAEAAAPGAITVLTVYSDAAETQADALTRVLRSTVAKSPGWETSGKDFSLEVLTIELSCPMLPEAPDEACLQRIADQTQSDRVLWAIVDKQEDTITGAAHLWTRGQGERTAPLSYPATLTDPSLDTLKAIGEETFAKLTGTEKAATSVVISAGVGSGEVFVDGASVGKLDGGEGTFAIEPGTHKIVVKTTGYADSEATVEVLPNAATAVPMTLVKESSSQLNYKRLGGYVSVGAGAAFLIAGLVASANVSSANSTLDGFRNEAAYAEFADLCEGGTGRADIERACDKGKANNALQFVYYGIAAVTGGVGAYLIATSPSALTITPSASPDSARLDMTYRW